MEFAHRSVLLHECIDALAIKPDGIYLDGTLGGAGHSLEICKRLTTGRLIGVDRDTVALEAAKKRLEAHLEKVTLVHSNFSELRAILDSLDIACVDGMLFDLGVSSPQLDDGERGFSYMADAPLDMRMNERGGMTAADVVNRYDEEALARLFYLYGEMKNSRSLASAIVKKRQTETINTVEQLINVVKPLMGRERVKKDMAKVFQALRIEVNHEMDALQEMLEAALRVLRPGGRLTVLTYHSLEDRMVKNFMRAGNIEGKVEQDFFGNRLSPMRPVNNKVIVPTAEEQERNPRSRSAKLRIAEKV